MTSFCSLNYIPQQLRERERGNTGTGRRKPDPYSTGTPHLPRSAVQNHNTKFSFVQFTIDYMTMQADSASVFVVHVAGHDH